MGEGGAPRLLSAVDFEHCATILQCDPVPYAVIEYQTGLDWKPLEYSGRFAILIITTLGI
jgi:hypothetical protein